MNKFTDGIVEIYTVGNIAPAGYPPQEGLTFKQKLRFNEKTLGLQRLNAALQMNVNISRVINCPYLDDISTQDIAVIRGKQYKVTIIQKVMDRPPTMDLSLQRLEGDYEIP